MASKPSGVYADGREWLVVLTMSRPAKNAAPNSVVEIWQVPPPMGRIYRRKVKQFCADFGVSPNVPVEDLPDWAVKILLEGTTKADEEEHDASFDGVGPTLRAWYEKTESSFMREWLSQYMHEATCPLCRHRRP